jgi:molybdenum ABC transporter, periplasmic molybdate-binding protein
MKRSAGVLRSLALFFILGSLVFCPVFGRATELSVFCGGISDRIHDQGRRRVRETRPRRDHRLQFRLQRNAEDADRAGAECDLFISAGQKQMNELDISAGPKVNKAGLDFVKQGTRFNIVSNKVVLIVPKGRNTKGISDFKDVATDKVSLVALGNSDVPVGQYSEEVYKNLGLWDQLKEMNRITYGSNVKEVLSQVAAAAVDCGVVYGTDAASAEGRVEVVAHAPEGSHRPIVYPAAVMRATRKPVAAAAFASFLRSPECAAIFESYGFSKPGK